MDIAELEKYIFSKVYLQGQPLGIRYTTINNNISNWSSREE